MRRCQHGPSALQIVEWIQIIQDKVLPWVLVTMQSMVKTIFYCSDSRNVVSKRTPGADANFSFMHAKTLNHPA